MLKYTLGCQSNVAHGFIHFDFKLPVYHWIWPSLGYFIWNFTPTNMTLNPWSEFLTDVSSKNNITSEHPCVLNQHYLVWKKYIISETSFSFQGVVIERKHLVDKLCYHCKEQCSVHINSSLGFGRLLTKYWVLTCSNRWVGAVLIHNITISVGYLTFVGLLNIMSSELSVR